LSGITEGGFAFRSVNHIDKPHEKTIADQEMLRNFLFFWPVPVEGSADSRIGEGSIIEVEMAMGAANVSEVVLAGAVRVHLISLIFQIHFMIYHLVVEGSEVYCADREERDFRLGTFRPNRVCAIESGNSSDFLFSKILGCEEG